jgi:drug/metabolite transporter (DMT)-like permease
MSRHGTSSLTIVACALSWGFIPILVREVDLSPLTLVFARVTLSCTFLAATLVVIGRRDLLRAPPRSVLALGPLLALHWCLYFAAIKQTSVASAVLVTYTGPVFMALLAPALLREHVPGVSIAALASSLAGIALITMPSGGGEEVRAAGVALALGAAVTMALLIVLLKRYAADVTPVTVAFWEDLVAAIVLIPTAFVGRIALGGADVAYLLTIGVLLTGAAGIAYVSALRHVPATTAGILMYMEPVAAALLAAALLGEGLTPPVIVGGLLILGAGTLVALRSPPPLVSTTGEAVPHTPSTEGRAAA